MFRWLLLLVIGWLSIPSLEIYNQPIRFSAYDSVNMEWDSSQWEDRTQGVAYLDQTSWFDRQQGAIVLISHADGVLGPITHIDPGDWIIIQTQNETYKFIVTFGEIVHYKLLTERVVTPDHLELILIICASSDPADPNRIFIHADLVTSYARR